MELREIIIMILDKTYLMSIGTIGENGPWVSDVVFVYDEADLSIYWLSKGDTMHSRNIEIDPRAAATITLSTQQGEENVGLQIEGTAEKVEGDNLNLASKHLLKRHKPAPQKEGEIFKSGQSWYRLKPVRIEVIYEPYWGFEKQVFNIS